MEKQNKRKAELGKSVEGKVLLFAGAENADGILHNFRKELEDHRYEVFKCNGVGEFVSEMKKNRCDIILTEGNLLGHMDVSQQLIRILSGINYPVIMISSDGNHISSHYHWLKGDIVRPILELVELFCERITKSGEVKRLKEKIKQVELPDEEERLEEVEHDELPDERNKKKIEREKAGEHHQRMVWTGEPEQTFVEIVTDLDKNGKVTGKEVWKRMQEKKSLKHISIKQVNSHLQVDARVLQHRVSLKVLKRMDSRITGQ